MFEAVRSGGEEGKEHKPEDRKQETTQIYKRRVKLFYNKLTLKFASNKLNIRCIRYVRVNG